MGSLVAAIGCVFALAGGVVAFNGWPQIDPVSSGPSLVVSDAPRAPLQVASVRPAKASHRAGQNAVAGTHGSHALRRVIASAPHRTVSRGSDVTTHTDSKPAPTTQTSPASPLTPVADTAEQTTNGVGKAVTDTTGALGQVVGGPVGQTVTNLGATLGGTVSKTGTLLANLLRAIRPGN